MVLCWLFSKDKAMRTQIHRVGAEKGHNGVFLFAFGRFTQSQTHPSPKGNAKASDWHIFLIQGQKGLPGSPFLLHPNATYVNCGWGEGRSSWNSRYPPAPGSRYACLSGAVPAPVQSKKHDLGEIWHKSLKSRIYRAPGQHFEQRLRRKMAEGHRDVPSLPYQREAHRTQTCVSHFPLVINPLRDIRLVQLKINMPLILVLEV